MNLLVHQGRKRGESGNASDREQKDSETELAQELDSAGIAESNEPSGGRKRRKEKGTDTDGSIENTELLVAAVDRLSETTTVTTFTACSRHDRQTSKRLDIFERRLETQAEDNTESQNILAKILEKLN